MSVSTGQFVTWHLGNTKHSLATLVTTCGHVSTATLWHQRQPPLVPVWARHVTSHVVSTSRVTINLRIKNNSKFPDIKTVLLSYLPSIYLIRVLVNSWTRNFGAISKTISHKVSAYKKERSSKYQDTKSHILYLLGMEIEKKINIHFWTWSRE